MDDDTSPPAQLVKTLLAEAMKLVTQLRAEQEQLASDLADEVITKAQEDSK